MNDLKNQSSSPSRVGSERQADESDRGSVNLRAEVIGRRSARALDLIRRNIEESRAQASQRIATRGTEAPSAPALAANTRSVKSVPANAVVTKEPSASHSASLRAGRGRLARMAAFGLVALGVAHFTDLVLRVKSSQRSDEPTKEKATYVEKAKSAPPPQRVTPAANKNGVEAKTSPTPHMTTKEVSPPSKEAKSDSKPLQPESKKAPQVSPLGKPTSSARFGINRVPSHVAALTPTPSRSVLIPQQPLDALVVPKVHPPGQPDPTPSVPKVNAPEAATAPPSSTRVEVSKVVEPQKTEEIQGPPLYLTPTAKALNHNPLVERIQERLNEMKFTAPDGKPLLADGRFGSKTGFAIEQYRISAKLPPGHHIDQDLVDRLAPAMTMANVEKGLLTVTSQNAGKGINPIVKEVQGIVNRAAQTTIVAESGIFSRELTNVLREVQGKNGLKVTGSIDNATVRLLRGESLDSVISLHGVVLSPSTSKSAPELPLVKAVQERLNTVLGEKGPVHGRFDEATAKRLSLAQKAGKVRERGVLGAETLLMLEEVGKGSAKAELFAAGLAQIKLVDSVVSKLSIGRRQALMTKMETCSPGMDDAEVGFVDMCREVDVNLSKPDSIARFQGARGLSKTGKVDIETAEHLDEVVTAQWFKNCVLNHEDCYDWKEAPQEINVIGLRGWDRFKGQNNNEFNQWNDTIAIVWTDKEGRTRVLEYVATTDPGLLTNSKSPVVAPDGRGAVGHLKPGQYRYKEGYYHGMSGFGVPIQDGEVRVFRDTNHNGIIDEGDAPELKKAGPIARLIDRVKSFWGDDTFKFHGMRTSANPNDVSEVGGFSAGCQVPKISLEQYKKEISPLLRDNPGTFPYTLIDMSTRDQFNSQFAGQIAQRDRFFTRL